MIRFRLLLSLYLATSLFGIAVKSEWKKYEKAIKVLAEEHGKEIDNSYQTLLTAQKESIQQSVGKFPCTTENLKSSDTPPTSVHRLKPEDVKVVAALGDSLTSACGAGASTILGMLYDYRGVSWSVGGDNNFDERVSYPNVLKLYNPDVTGYSLGIGNEKSKGANFNVAIRGQDARHLYAQTANLINRMRNDPDIDFEQDWKVITMEIGGNDICDYDRDGDAHSPENFIFGVTQSLDKLMEEVPRALVNLVLVIDITPILEVGTDWTHWFCDIAHESVCGSALSNMTAAKNLQHTYNRLLEDLVSTGDYDRREDFTVVIQPFLSNLVIDPTQDVDFYRQFFAPDCTHPSTLGHQVMAAALWNNMIQPVGEKFNSLDLAKLEFHCPPNNHPYFYTRLNSDDQPLAQSNGWRGADGEGGASGATTPWVLTTLLVVVAVPCLVVTVWILWRRRKTRQNYQRMPTTTAVDTQTFKA